MLLFGEETWVVSPMMEQALSAFIHGAARRLTGRQPWRGRDGKWHYPSLEGAMTEAGLTDIRTSIQRRQKTVTQYIATRPLLDLCEGARQREMAFEVYGKQIQSVPRFKYLGRILTEGDDNWPAVAGNLENARKSWGRLQGILSREGATKRV